MALQSLLLAQGRYDEMAAVLDSAAPDVRGSTEAMYLINAIAGAPVSDRAAEVAATRCSNPLSHNVPMLWLCGMWASSNGDAEQMRAIQDAVAVKSNSNPSRRDSLIARSLTAFEALAAGDSATALELFGALKTTGLSGDRSWQPGEPRAAERITLARLLLARGDYEEAHWVASAFDHPQPGIYVAFLPARL